MAPKKVKVVVPPKPSGRYLVPPRRSGRIVGAAPQPVHAAPVRTTPRPPPIQRESGAYDRFHFMNAADLTAAATDSHIDPNQFGPLAELANRRRLRERLREYKKNPKGSKKDGRRHAPGRVSRSLRVPSRPSPPSPNAARDGAVRETPPRPNTSINGPTQAPVEDEEQPGKDNMPPITSGGDTNINGADADGQSPSARDGTANDEAIARALHLEKEEADRKDREKKDKEDRDRYAMLEADMSERPELRNLGQGNFRLRQINNNGGVHCLYRAFAMAHQHANQVRTGITPTTGAEDMMSLVVRARVRAQWLLVTDHRATAASRSRLPFYRAMNAGSIGPGNNEVDTWLDRQEQDPNADHPGSPTHVEVQDRLDGSLAYQIMSSTGAGVYASQEMFQLLADAYDVEILVHSPYINGTPPAVQYWATYTRGMYGRPQVHLISYQNSNHFTAAVPLRPNDRWTQHLLADQSLRQPAPHSRIAAVDGQLPGPLPEAPDDLTIVAQGHSRDAGARQQRMKPPPGNANDGKAPRKQPGAPSNKSASVGIGSTQKTRGSERNSAIPKPDDENGPSRLSNGLPPYTRLPRYKATERVLRDQAVLHNIGNRGMRFHQMNVDSDGHNLFRAFGMAYRRPDLIQAGVQSLPVQGQHRNITRRVLQDWWKIVTQNLDRPESQARLPLYRAIGAGLARSRSQQSFTPEEDRGLENLARQISATERDTIPTDLGMLQLLADAFDVEIILHVPHVEGIHPRITGWNTISRGEFGARQVHLVYYCNLGHFNALAPAARSSVWTEHLRQRRSRCPVFGPRRSADAAKDLPPQIRNRRKAPPMTIPGRRIKIPSHLKKYAQVENPEFEAAASRSPNESTNATDNAPGEGNSTGKRPSDALTDNEGPAAKSPKSNAQSSPGKRPRGRGASKDKSPPPDSSPSGGNNQSGN